MLALATLLGRPISPDDRFALAVSGGPDSLAMLVLALDAGLSATVLTVDHGLRPESAAEAAHVEEICAACAVPHKIIKVEVAKSASVQSAARRARYAAMGAWCEAAGIPWLLTAHHADDQAETLLMRLSRGSGLSGMAGIRPRRRIDGRNVELLRPLLGARKADLAAVVEAAGLSAVDDPGNDAAVYDRTLARRLLRQSGIDIAHVAETAAHLAEAEAALAWTANEAWAGRVTRDDERVTLDARGLPAELARRLVLRALSELNPAASPEGPAVARLIAGLRAGTAGNLAGVVAKPGTTWRFAAAPPRRAANRDETPQ